MGKTDIFNMCFFMVCLGINYREGGADGLASKEAVTMMFPATAVSVREGVFTPSLHKVK